MATSRVPSRRSVAVGSWNPSGAQQRTVLLTESLGGAPAAAELLGVSPGKLSRWMNGAESPGVDAWRTIIDLDYALARAQMIWGREVAVQWILGSNAHLGGARPVDVLRNGGTAEIIDALDAAQSGAF